MAPPPRDWVVDDHFAAGTLAVLGGFGGTSKTMLALQLGVGLAIAHKPHKPYHTAPAVAAGMDIPKAGNSLIILGEEDAGERDRRVGAIHQHITEGYPNFVKRRYLNLIKKHCETIPAAGRRISLTKLANGNLTWTPLVQDTIDRAKSLAAKTGSPTRLIVFDHARLIAGGGELNSAEDATVLTTALTHIAQETGACVLLLAHSPKSSMGDAGKNADHGSIAHSTAFVDNARAAFVLRTMDEKTAAKLDLGSKDRHSFVQLMTVKNNYAGYQEHWLERVSISSHHVSLLDSWDAPMKQKDTGPSQQDVADDAMARQIARDLVAKSPGRWTATKLKEEVKAQAKLPQRDANRVVDDMLDGGELASRTITQEDRKAYRR